MTKPTQDDPVLEALELAKGCNDAFVSNFFGKFERQKHSINRAIAIQKAQAKVIDSLKDDLSHGRLTSLKTVAELAALDKLKEGK